LRAYRKGLALLNETCSKSAPIASRTPRKPTLASVAKQASKAAIPVARYEVKPDGTIVIVTSEPSAAATGTDEWDEALDRHGKH
jgi:hypothetical protein